MAEKYENKGKASENHPTRKRGRPRKTSQIPEAASPHTTVSGPSQQCTPQQTNLDAERIVKAEVGLETQSNDGKPMLYLDGQGFLPSRLAASAIGDIIKRNYTKPWPSWKKIPDRDRNSMFDEFWAKFSFSPPDYRWAHQNFQRRCSVLMANRLLKARSTLVKPYWIEDGIWEKLCEHWKSEDFITRSEQARINRASNNGASHTGGSISASQHRANMIKETGMVPTPSELYRRLHQRKDNTWVDSKSKNLNEAFTRSLNQLTESALVEGKPPPSELDVWSDVARSKKGKVYGLGVDSTTVRVGPCYPGSSSSMEWITKQEFDELRREMEQIRKERDELQTKVSNTERHGVESTAVVGGACHQGSASSMELITKQEFDELRREMEQVRKERDELQTKVSNTERYGGESAAVRGGPCHHGSSSSMELIQEFDELRREMEQIRKERDELQTKVSNTERHGVESPAAGGGPCPQGSSSSMELIIKFEELRREMEEVKKEINELLTEVSNTERLGVEFPAVRGGPCYLGSSSSMELITKQEFEELMREMEEVRKERNELLTKVSNTERLGVELLAVRGGPCHLGSSSSMELITKQEFDELRREMEEARKERNELLTKGPCHLGSSSPLELITKQEFDELRREMEEARKERNELLTKGPCHLGSSSPMELITKQEFEELMREMEEARKERNELLTRVSNTERLGVEFLPVRGGPCHLGSSSSMEFTTKQEFDELRREMEEVRRERNKLHIKVSNTEKLIEENNALIQKIIESISDQN